MASATGDIVLDERQQALFDEMCRVIDGTDDDLALMTRTQDMVNLLLKRAEDAGLRDQTLGEVSRFFLGLMKARDLSPDYRMRKLRMFSKASVKILIAKRPHMAAEAPAEAPANLPFRRATDGVAVPG
jgi:hypothetical protein